MEKQKLTTYAAMVKDEDDIKRNSMKLYSYLLCIAGKEPAGTGRLFQQKNLVLTQIKKYTNLEPKTIKLYLYELETNGLIEFRGPAKFTRVDHSQCYTTNSKGERKLNKTQLRKLKEQEAFSTWKLRERNDYYRIPRPERYTPIPEITLDKLNKNFGCSELEYKTYVLCCAYRDIQVELYGGTSKQITYESFREAIGQMNNRTVINKQIKAALYFLKGVGLIDFKTGFYYNTKGAKIECFELIQVNYYSDEEDIIWEETDFLELDDSTKTEIQDRLNAICKGNN